MMPRELSPDPPDYPYVVQRRALVDVLSVARFLAVIDRVGCETLDEAHAWARSWSTMYPDSEIEILQVLGVYEK